MKIAVWYHAALNGGNPPINEDWATGVMAEQMTVLKQSGLLDACTEFHVGANGDFSRTMIARCLSGDKATFHVNGPGVEYELPTLNALRQWVVTHRDWLVMYHHTKCASHPGQDYCAGWRHCMEAAVVKNWKRCVQDLTVGFESTGVHWMTPETHPGSVHWPYWAGTFWWARAEFLFHLGPLPQKAAHYNERFLAEGWIGGMGHYRRPHVKDYANHPFGKCFTDRFW